MTETTNKKLVVFKALQIANEQRTTYGLRYNDFTRYRKHCAARTHRLRSSLKMTHGKGRDFKKLPTVNLDNIQDKYLELLLLEVERAWAYSQDLISLSSQPTNESKASTLAHSATARFRRAVHWSTQMLSYCQSLFASSRLSSENLLQATIYTLIINGRFLRYRDHFEDALVQLCVARHILDELAATASRSRDQALAILYSDQISPEIRYCAHELGHPEAYNVQSIVKAVASKHLYEIVENCDALIENLKAEAAASSKIAGRKKLDALMWEDQPIPVRDPGLVDVLLKVQEAEARLSLHGSGTAPPKIPGQGLKVKQTDRSSSKKGVAAYDMILLALSDAEEMARKLVEVQQISGTNSGTLAAGTRDIHFVHAYIVYQLLSRRIQRDLLLISALLLSQESLQTHHPSSSHKLPSIAKPKPEQVDGRLYPAVVKLLDTVLQSLNQMRTLSIVDESPDLASAVEARVSYTKARRCLYLARCYAPGHKYVEALSLIQFANIHLRETHSVVSSLDFDPVTSEYLVYYPLLDKSLEKFENDLSALGLQLKNDWFAHNGGSADPDNKSYQKPLFFDIALNYVQLDMHRLQERAGKKPLVPHKTNLNVSSGIIEQQPERKQAARPKAKEVRAETPEPQPPARSGLGSLLGGWWGRS